MYWTHGLRTSTVEFVPTTASPASSLTASAQLWTGHAKGSRGYRRLLAALAFAGVATFAQLYSTQALLPRLSADLRIDAAQAALTVSLATLGLAVAVLPWSFVADRVGRVPAMTAGVAVATLLGLLAPLAPGIGVLLALRCLEGAA